jgi:hypothetical protein
MATSLDPQAEKLRRVHTIPALVTYLHDELGWPVDVDDWEDAVYDWQPQELNLKPEHAVAIKSIKQLRPLVTGQPWGIFFVDFDKGKLPIVVLRRMLNGLAIKSRAQSGGHQTWLARDLLFVSSYGEAQSREITLAHFTDESELGDLPTLRVLGWDEADTALELSYVARTLKEKLRWPAKTASKADQDAWRSQWAGAFSLKYRQVINDSKSLALALAELAKRIRSRANSVLALESDTGHLRQLHKAFKENLIADLSPDGFADMFAQTITYGLFTARASRESGALVADNLSDMVPSTNPFLKELLGDFLSAGGRARHKVKRVDFDELGINEVVTTLRDVPMDAVLRSFNASKPGDDPVIHFYEDFLKAYDKAMRAKRGVFYTPSPVVQFIVRSVDEILKTEFGIEDGLASTITWGEMMARKPELKLPKFCTPATPFVQVLDPATGTGTFIVEVITQVHTYMRAKWAQQGKVTKAQWQPLWVDYVQQHLLPRLYAFELMMAPYAIAHMKIGLKLAETGYTFPEGGPRVNVFLTNALEPAHAINPGLEFEAPMLAHEAATANRAKEQLAATVVLGNPPYSGESTNKGDWITKLMRSRLADGADSYFRFNEADLGERNPKWVNNDYVKFMRLAQSRLAALGTGVLGYITSNSYLESPTFRGVRQSLLHSLPHLRIVDLHGNSKRGETADGDENVFEITEGVAIAVGNVKPGLPPRVEHADLTGLRQLKYETLITKGLQLLQPFAPSGERLQLVRSDSAGVAQYECGWSLPLIAPVNSVGIVTARDDLCIHFTEKQAWDAVRDFAKRDPEDARAHYRLGKDARDWQVELAQSDLHASGPEKKHLQPILYRPFDVRQTYYTGQTRGFLCMPRPEVMRHMLAGVNVGIVCCRQMSQLDEEWSLVGSTRLPIESCTISNKTKEINYLFPLWRYQDAKQTANLSPSFAIALQSALHLAPTDYRPEDPSAPLHAEKIFHYIYAVLHSPTYRQRYAAFLRTDFPRIPIPGSRTVFDALAQLGSQLVQWHLLEHPDAAKIIADSARPACATAFFGTDFSLQKVAEKGKALAELSGDVGKVFINASSGFANVRLGVWQHTIGGYQVLHKWLDDRRKAGRTLSQDDITHWLRVYAALEATQTLMQQVDTAIDAHGGWPGTAGASSGSAFSQNHPPPDAATLAAEQMAQKEQAKAHKKAAAAAKKKAAYASPTGANSLFDFDDDLDALAEASGAPPRPKAKATPAKAAGGQSTANASKADDITDAQAMCALRAVLAQSAPLTRIDLIRQTARKLGCARTTKAMAGVLDNAIRRAVGRGIAQNHGGHLSLLTTKVEDYDREFLKQQLLKVIPASGVDKAQLPVQFARHLGFARVGPVIESTVWSLVRSLQRPGQVQPEGRGDAARYRRV